MSNTSNAGAFPFPHYTRPDGDIHWGEQGLTKREYVAAMALQGWLAGCGNAYNEFTGPASYPQKVAESCVKFADALLTELA